MQRHYVSRSIDGDCLRALRAGRNFFVSGPPRTGKTRLRRRVAEALRASGLRVAEIDLASIGPEAPAGDVWFELARACTDGFGLSDPRAFWQRYAALDPAERWQRYLQSAPAGSPVVLLVDSLESLIIDGYDIEGFFGALRPGDGIGYTPLVTCLFGALHRLDLGLDIRTASLGRSALRAWFRTAVELRPEPFTAEEAAGFLPRLHAPGGDPRALLDAIMGWTAGHPALTAALVDAIGDGGPLMISGSEADTVAATVEALFVDVPIADVPALAMAEAWADCTDPRAAARCWQRVLRGEAPAWRPGEEAHRQLRMGGMVRVEGSVLLPANRLFTAVFDEAWCDARLLAEALPARARLWLASGRDPGHLLAGAALRRASAWAEVRAVEPEVGELLTASWLGARRAEAERAASEPPAAISAPVFESAAPAGAMGAAPAASSALSASPGPGASHPTPLRWLAAAVVLMGLVATGLLAALWQSRGSVEGAVAALAEGVAPMPRATPQAPAPVAPTPAVTETRPAPGAVAARRADQRRAEEQRAEERQAEQRAAERRRAEQRAAERRRAEQRRAERAQKRRAERRAAKRRRAEERHAESAAPRAAPRASAARPEPAPAPAAAIARQAGTYRRSLVRCKHYDLPHAVQLRLTVQPDGRVADVAITRGAADRIDAACIVESAGRFRFAPFAGGPLTAAVDYRL